MKKKFDTREVNIGKITIGKNNPIAIQSMTNTDTLDIGKTVSQIMELQDNGCDIVRLTIQGTKQALALDPIKNLLLQKNYDIPLVSDIHFFPKAALMSLDFVDKVRINPGNYAETRAVFKKKIFSDTAYQEELLKVEEKLLPLIDKLKKQKKALRIGVNHGSLSDRIMSKYGNTVEGMVISAIEYIDICRKYNFHNLVLSMKSSNTKVMIDAYRSLVAAMINLKYDYPLHLGVTEAGEGVDGEIKSAVGIGSLLLDGIGNTIRVSLTNDPVEEIEPCKKLVNLHKTYQTSTFNISPIIKQNKNAIIALDKMPNDKDLTHIDYVLNKEKYSYIYVDKKTNMEVLKNNSYDFVIFKSIFPIVFNLREFYKNLDKNHSNKILLDLTDLNLNIFNISEIGSLFIDGIIDGALINIEQKTIVLNILQASNKKNTKTEFISCPGCGRTLYNIQKITKILKDKVPNIPGLKIAVMGCIVNGPGEMMDADFGYIGKGKGKIDLYKDAALLEKDLTEDDAIEQLLNLIKNYNS